MKLHTFNQDQERDKEVKKRKIEYKKKSIWKKCIILTIFNLIFIANLKQLMEVFFHILFQK